MTTGTSADRPSQVAGRHERMLDELVAGWNVPGLDGELTELAGVSRVQVELRTDRRSVGRRILWTRSEPSALPGRTVRLAFIDLADLEELLAGDLEPMALLWGGRLLILTPVPEAGSVVATLPRPGADLLGGPGQGLLSLPAHREPPWNALVGGITRWVRACEQMLAHRWPAPPHRSTVNLRFAVTNLGQDLSFEVVQPRATPGPAGGTSVSMEWESGRGLWANLACQLVLYDALFCGLCTVDGDAETFVWLSRFGTNLP